MVPVSKGDFAVAKCCVEVRNLGYQQVIHNEELFVNAGLLAPSGSNIVQKKASVLYKPLLTLVINKSDWE